MFFKQELRSETETDEGVKIVYDDVAPYAKENSHPQIIEPGLWPRVGLRSGTGLHPRSTKTLQEFPDLKLNLPAYPGYSLALPGFALLNGSFINFPSEPGPYGFISNQISDENGLFGYYDENEGLRPRSGLHPRRYLYPSTSYSNFVSNPILTIKFDGVFSSVGLYLTFNTLSGDYSNELNIKWFSNGSLLSDMDFYPDSVSYFCNNYVQYYDRIVITFKSTSKPHRPIFLVRIDYGIYRDFMNNELLETNCIQEINAISKNISINTLDFTVRTKSDIPFDLQKKQRLQLYFDGHLLGNFFIKNGAKKNIMDYHISSHDAIGILDGNEFPGGIYNGETVSAVVAKIFDGEDFPYLLSEELRNIQLYGYIPYTTKRNALVQIAFAIGAVVDTSNYDGIIIYPQETEVSGEFTKDDAFDGITLEHGDIVTGIRLTSHSYHKTNESQELYNDVLNGTVEVIFTEAYHSLTISGGTIQSYGDNFAYIRGTGGTVILTGLKYNHMTTSQLKENPLINYNKNIKDVADATLIHSGNAGEAIERIYNYYQRAENVIGEVLLGDKMLGQIVEIDTVYDGKKIGTIESIDYSFANKIRAEVVIHE